MHFITLDLCKFTLLVVIPLYFRECALLIVNILLLQKPDYAGRNLMTQTQYSCINVVITQI